MKVIQKIKILQMWLKKLNILFIIYGICYNTRLWIKLHWSLTECDMIQPLLGLMEPSD